MGVYPREHGMCDAHGDESCNNLQPVKDHYSQTLEMSDCSPVG